MTPNFSTEPQKQFQEKFPKHLCLQKIHFSEQQSNDDPAD
jgi:hypothetical protein